MSHTFELGFGAVLKVSAAEQASGRIQSHSHTGISVNRFRVNWLVVGAFLDTSRLEWYHEP